MPDWLDDAVHAGDDGGFEDREIEEASVWHAAEVATTPGEIEKLKPRLKRLGGRHPVTKFAVRRWEQLKEEG